MKNNTEAFEVVAEFGIDGRNCVGTFATEAEAIAFAKNKHRQEPDLKFRVWTLNGDNSVSGFVAESDAQK